MAKADCTQLEKAISDLALSIGEQEGIETFDDVVAEIQKSFPVLPRIEIATSIVNATGRDVQNTDAARNVLKEIKQIARLEKSLEDQIDELQQHLAEGTLPEKKDHARRERGGSYADQLRDIRDDLKKQLGRSEPAQKARLEKQIAALDERLATGDFTPRKKPDPLPQSAELERLTLERDRLRRRVRVEVAKLKPRTFWSKAALPFDVARDLLTTGEFSPVLRQGAIFSYGHPVKTVSNVGKMLEAWASEQAADRQYNEMMAHPEMPGYIRAGGYISAMGPDATLSQREEIALSRIFYEAPLIKRFTRAGVVFLNKLRFDMYLAMKDSISSDGELTTAESEALTHGINEATGRAFKNGMAIAGLERAFFSIQYLTSRFQLLTLRPLWWYGTNRTRGAFAREYFRALMGLAGIYLLGRLAGGEEEWDPRSSDFGKIRFGNLRVDPLFGLSQIIVFATRLRTGETKSTKTGKVTALRGEEHRPMQRDISDVIGSFARSKMHPLIAIPWNIAAGEKPSGEPTDFIHEAWNATHPITWEDIYQSAKEYGLAEAAAVSFVAFFGMSIQQYQDNWERRK